MSESLLNLADEVDNWLALEGYALQHTKLLDLCDTQKDLWEVYSAFASHGGFKKNTFLAHLSAGLPGLSFKTRPIQTIALYYRNVTNGGAQRVVAQLCNMLVSLSSSPGKPFNVILVTEDGPLADEYPIDERVRRFFVPLNTSSRNANYSRRAHAWKELLDTYTIDLVIDSMWVDECTAWDILCIKSHQTHPAVALHCHNTVASLYQMSNKPEELAHLSNILDAAICLSESDAAYWRKFVGNTAVIGNPLPPRIELKHEDSLPTVLWVGRISREKNPLDIIPIMQELKSLVPNAVCRIVGTGDTALLDSMKALASEMGIAESIIFEGYQDDVSSFYSSSHVLLGTSSYEGWSLVYFEAASHGLPVVYYDLPYLTFSQEIEGPIAIPQDDVKQAALQIAALLEDEPYRQSKRKQTTESYSAFLRRHSLEKQWLNLFSSLEEGNAILPERQDIPLTAMALHHSHAGDFLREELKNSRRIEKEQYVQLTELQKNCEELLETVLELEENLKLAHDEYEKLRSSKSFKIGYKLTEPARRIRKLLQRSRR